LRLKLDDAGKISEAEQLVIRTTYRVFNVPGYEKRTLDYEPFDNFAAHIFKVRNGQIYEIEAVGYVGAGANLPSPF